MMKWMNEMNSKYCQHNAMKKHRSGSNKEGEKNSKKKKSFKKSKIEDFD